jgi:hypothetical protein
MCDRGGTYYYKGTGSTGSTYGRHNRSGSWGGKRGGRFGQELDGWTEAEVPRGVMCSATAWASFAAKGAIDIREI